MPSRRCARQRCCSLPIPSSSTISVSPASRSAASRMLSLHSSWLSPATRATAMHTSAWESPWRSWATPAGPSLPTTAPLSSSPALTEAWFRAGALVYTLGHREEAIGCFRRAAATGGNTSFGRLGSARALLTEDRNQEAEQVLRRTVARDPNNAMAHDLLGNLLSEFGRFDEARECFERAIAIAPLLAGCYYDLVRCRPVTSDDDGLLQRMEAALATPGLEVAQRVRLHLALGKAADDLGDYALAMQHFDAADSVRRLSLSFDSAAFAVEIDRLIARCTPEWIAQRARTRQLRCDAGIHPRHAALRHNSRRANRLQPSPGRGRRRVAFLERARSGVAPLRRARRTRHPSLPRRRRIISACYARSRPRRPE